MNSSTVPGPPERPSGDPRSPGPPERPSGDRRSPGRGARDPLSIDQRLEALARQPFRAKFHLRGRDRATARLKGPATLRWHAYDLIAKRLAPAEPYKDGRQTPYRGHPVFVAQHATATCCRSCLQRWHGIPKGRELTRFEHVYVVDVICRWIAREMADGAISGQDPCRADPDHEIS